MAGLKEQAQALAGDAVVIVGAWQEPSIYVDTEGNQHSSTPFEGSQEKTGCVLVSNGRFIGRGDDLEKAVADLLENVSK